MDFFARQDQARRKTKWLVIYFALAVISIGWLVYLSVRQAWAFLEMIRR